MHFPALVCLLVVGLFTAGCTAARQQSQTVAQVMILGVYHFNNPNADMLKTSFPDHLSQTKQREIAEVLDLLAKFQPTKIVVEAPQQTEVQRNYQAYLKGEYPLTANEIEQLGYRLAKHFGHQQIYPADHRIAMDMNSVFVTARETGNKSFLEATQKVIDEAQAMQKRHEQMTVRQALVEMNEPAWQDTTRDFYLQMLRVRGGEQYVGADVLTNWYQRNFRILTNIMQTIESPQDRVLVIFGQGHVPYLREGIRSNSDMRLVEANDYLRNK